MGGSKFSRCEVKAAIIAFLDGPTGPWDWDDFISVPIKDPFLDSVRLICNAMPVGFPPSEGSRHYCGIEGLKLMRSIADAL